MSVVLDELKQLQPQASSNRQFRPGQHLRTFFQDQAVKHTNGRAS